MTALMLAAKGGHIKTVKVLLERGASRDPRDKVIPLGAFRHLLWDMFSDVLLVIVFGPSFFII
jgi:hypothetical protein